MTNEILKQLGIIFGGTVAAVAVLAYLSKTLLTQLFAKDMETFKADLKTRTDSEIELLRTKLKGQSDLEMERLRHELKIRSFEYETRFKRLHEDVARNLAETYPLLRDFYVAVSSLVSPIELAGEPNKEEKLAKASFAAKAFHDHFLKNRIYYPKKLYGQLDELGLLLVDTANKFKRAYVRDKAGGADAIDEWNESWSTIKEKAKPLFEAMHDEFQRHLGFQDEPTGETPEAGSPGPAGI